MNQELKTVLDNLKLLSDEELMSVIAEAREERLKRKQVAADEHKECKKKAKLKKKAEKEEKKVAILIDPSYKTQPINNILEGSSCLRIFQRSMENDLKCIFQHPELLTRVTGISCEMMNITYLPESIKALSNVTTIHTLAMHIKKFSLYSKDLINLKELVVLDYKLKNRSDNDFDEIDQFPNIKRLRIGNSLTHIPHKVFNLENLVELDLTSNDLESLSEEIFKLKNLKKLDLILNKKLNKNDEIIKKLIEKGVDVIIGKFYRVFVPCFFIVFSPGLHSLIKKIQKKPPKNGGFFR